jgi:hypothetical protein
MPVPPIPFMIAYSIYMLVSLGIAFGVNTIPAVLIYTFLLLPFQLICIAYAIAFGYRHRHQSCQINLRLLGLAVLCQGLMVLTSPASCYGFKQGDSCYSLLQMLTANVVAGRSLGTLLDPTTPHWHWLERLFPVMLLGYGVVMGGFLATMRGRSPH